MGMLTMTQIWEPVQKLTDELNPAWFSADALRGIFVLLLIIGIVWSLIKGLGKLVFSGVMLLILIQIAHVFGQSAFAQENVPFMAELFKYDVLQSLAQLFVGTPVATCILYVQAWINTVFSAAFRAAGLLWEIIFPWFQLAWDSLTHMGRQIGS